MGLFKLKLEIIKNEKSRLTTFHRRKTSMEKQIRELSTLCGIKVCMIAYGPNAKIPEIWPPNNNNKNEEIIELIEDYQSQSIRDRKWRTVDLSHFFNERQKRAEDLVEKTRKESCEIMYPSWDYRYDDLSEEHLRNFVNYLDGKIKAGKARIEELDGTRTKAHHLNLLDPSGSFLNSYDNEHSKMLEPSGLFLNSYDNPPSTTYASQVSNCELHDLSSQNDRQQEEEVGGVPFNGPPLMNPMMMMMNNNNELCGPSIMYVPVSVPVCYLPSAAMPIQLVIPQQYVPYTVAVVDSQQMYGIKQVISR